MRVRPLVDRGTLAEPRLPPPRRLALSRPGALKEGWKDGHVLPHRSGNLAALRGCGRHSDGGGEGMSTQPIQLGRRPQKSAERERLVRRAKQLAWLEGVMNFSPEAVACGYGYSKTIPERRFRRGVGVRCSVPGARSRRRSTVQPRLARSVQWTKVDRAHWLCLALYATRLTAVGSRLPADEEVAGGRRIRGDGPRFARTLAAFGG